MSEVKVVQVVKIARFLGDPTGYRLFPGYEDPNLGWVDAVVGFAGPRVKVNLALAYLIETVPGPLGSPYSPGAS